MKGDKGTVHSIETLSCRGKQIVSHVNDPNTNGFLDCLRCLTGRGRMSSSSLVARLKCTVSSINFTLTAEPDIRTADIRNLPVIR